MLGVVIFLVFIAISFFIGYKVGGRNAPVDAQPLQEARAEAWRQGYDAAMAYMSERRPGQPNAPPANEGTTLKDQWVGTPDGLSNSQAPVQPVVPEHPGFAQSAPEQPAAASAAANLALQRTPVIQRVPAPAQQKAAPVKVLSKRERELRNINITLYVAALLIVAAGALFLSFALPPLAKVIGLFVLAAAFYAGGLIVHATKKSLRPAAAAFAGTGLALLPLSAIATYNTVALSGPSVWLIFSVIGTVAVGFATIRLRSRVLAWVAVLILVSTAMAAAATLQRGVFYYLLLMLVLSILLMLAATRSKAVRGSLFFEATSATAQLLPLLVAALGAVLFTELSDSQILWAGFLLTVQLLLSVKLFDNLRAYRFFGARAAAMVTVVSACSVLGLRSSAAAVVLALALGIQGVLVLVHSSSYRKLLNISASLWRAERAVLWALVLLATAMAYVLELTGTGLAWISFAAVPVLMLMSVPALMRNAKIEAAALLLLALAPIGVALMNPQRPLVSLLLAFVLFLAVQRSAQGHTKLAYALASWGSSLVFGFFAARALLRYTVDTDLVANLSSTLALASTLGVWAAAFAWWILDIARPNGTGGTAVQSGWAAAGARLPRIAGSALVVLISLVLLRTHVSSPYHDSSVAGIIDSAWYAAGLVLFTLLVIASAVKYTAAASGGSRLDAAIRMAAGLGLLAAYGLSFLPQWWPVAELVALLLLGYFLRESRKAGEQGWKIAYAACAQLVFSSAVYWFVDRMHFDVHGKFAFFLLSLAVPQLLRLAASWRAGTGLRAELRVIAIAMLVFLPASTVGYAATAFMVDRGVLLLSAILLGIYGAAAFAADRELRQARQFYLCAPVGALTALAQVPAWHFADQTGWIRTAWWTENTAMALLLLIAVLGLAAEWLQRAVGSLTYATGLAMFLPLGMVLAWDPYAGWVVAALLAAAVFFAAMVHTRKVAWFAIAVPLFLFVGLRSWVDLWRSEQLYYASGSIDTAWVLLGIALVLGLLAASHGRFADPAPSYPNGGYSSKEAAAESSRLYLLMCLAAVFVAGFLLHLDNYTVIPVISGAVLIFAAAVGLRIFEFPARLNKFTVDVLFALATVLAMSSYSILDHMPAADVVCSYFSLVLAALAAWRVFRPLGQLHHGYVMAASALVSVVMLLNMVEGNSLTRTYALVFFAALISWGLKLGRKLYIWWGAAAITLAILWTLRSMAFLWLVLLGIGLIVVAVRKLVRVDRKPAEQQEDLSSQNLPARHPVQPHFQPGPPQMQRRPGHQSPAGNPMPWMNPQNRQSNRPDEADDQRGQ